MVHFHCYYNWSLKLALKKVPCRTYLRLGSSLFVQESPNKCKFCLTFELLQAQTSYPHSEDINCSPEFKYIKIMKIVYYEIDLILLIGTEKAHLRSDL